MTQPHPGEMSILLVEDEPLLREILMELLQDAGYQVLEASGGLEALEVAHQHGPGHIQLLVTDIAMPGMGGQQLAEAITSQNPSLKVLYLWGYSEYVLSGERKGPMAPILQKPFTSEVLVRKVKELLSQ